jgi:hypothetical protein
MQAKFRQLLSNRFNIQSLMNELCEGENKTMKELFLRAE